MTREPAPIHDYNDATRAHRGHFFDADSVRFFGSRIGSSFYPSAGRVRSYFTTSELSGFDHRSPRRFTVRAIDWRTGDVDEPTAGGGFLAHDYRSKADRIAARLAAADDSPPASLPCPVHDDPPTIDGRWCRWCLERYAPDVLPRRGPTDAQLRRVARAVRP